ncbi:MAG: hypothetical protein M3R71_00880, partial [Actinomycetota bacterium]|nr:hypothetical protein [Actinomycetota bacterium]
MILAVGVLVLGWQGVDWAAQSYRIAEVRHYGLVIWDSGWYGGSYPLGYSVLVPVLGALAGMAVVAVVAAGVAATAFDRLVTDVRGFRPWGSWLFAISTSLEVAIGQLPYLCGEAAGLVAVVALARRRGGVAVAFALVAALCSPLAGAFLALACGAAWLARYGDRRHLVGVAGVCAVVILALALLFPGVGPFPFPWTGLLLTFAVCAALLFVSGPAGPLIRWAAVGYALACLASFVVANPLGGNAPRLAAEIGVPLLACLPHRSPRSVAHWLGRH